MFLLCSRKPHHDKKKVQNNFSKIFYLYCFIMNRIPVLDNRDCLKLTHSEIGLTLFLFVYGNRMLTW